MPRREAIRYIYFKSGRVSETAFPNIRRKNCPIPDGRRLESGCFTRKASPFQAEKAGLAFFLLDIREAKAGPDAVQ